MLATTSWESMFETLCEYVRAKVRFRMIGVMSIGIFVLLTAPICFYNQTPENGEWDGKFFYIDSRQMQVKTNLT